MEASGAGIRDIREVEVAVRLTRNNTEQSTRVFFAESLRRPRIRNRLLSRSETVELVRDSIF